MKRWIMIAAVMIGWATAVHAQDTNAGQASRPSASTVTVTGCVERADQLAGNVTTGTTVDSLSFVLIKATLGTAADAPPVGTASASPKPDIGSMYRLDAKVATLNPHVGHRVEVSGVLDPAPTSAAASSDVTAATAPQLHVDSVKMVSQTCPQ
jgi:hypothetical protein